MLLYKEFDIWNNKELLKPLLVQHHSELATHKELMVLDPDYETYRKLQHAGRLFILGAFDEDALVGYSANTIAPSAHYQGLTVSNNDVIFLLPEYRQGGVGSELMRRTKELAKAKGARMQLWHVKPGSAMDTLLIASGAPIQDIIRSEVL